MKTIIAVFLCVLMLALPAEAKDPSLFTKVKFRAKQVVLFVPRLIKFAIVNDAGVKMAVFYAWHADELNRDR